MFLFKKLFKYLFLLILITGYSFINASTTDGTMDVTYHSALLCTNDVCTTTSQINFLTTRGTTIHVTDTAITGDAWSEDMGWIRFNPSGGSGGVSNTSEGVISGYAWGENSGWINFGPFLNNGATPVSINSTGQFTGFAWAQNYGWIKFDCSVTNACVTTDWRPISVRGSGTTSGSTSSPSNPPNPPTPPADTPPTPPTPPEEIPPAPPEEIPPTPPVDTPVPPVDIETPIISPEPSSPSSDVVDSISSVAQNFFSSVSSVFGSRLNTNLVITKDIINKNSKDLVLNFKKTKAKLSEIEDIPVVNVTSKVITTTGAISGASISIASVLFANPLSFSELFLIPFRLWSLILAAFGIKKRNVPWGTVYDSVTKQPLDPAYVVLQDLNGNEIATSITDLDGRYGFLVPQGRYRMIAQKTNYEFPSKKLSGKTEDELYPELYFNDIIDVVEGGVISKNIPMDSLKFDWNEFAKKDQKLMKFFSKRDLWIFRVSNILFAFGFFVTVVAVIGAPAFYNIAILTVYIVLLVLRKSILKPRAYGYIKQKETKDILSFAILRVFFVGGDNEVLHKVADETGKYYCIIGNGKYYVKIEKKNADESYTLVHTSLPIEVKNGYINERFEV
jgi:hypothetical protein